MENITIKINGMEVSAPKGSTILEAARLAHIEIPTLCFLKEINEIGACRICVVEVKGARSLVVSCVYPINEGMEVWTNTPKVLESRRKTLQLLLSNHDRKCLSCVRSGNCELQQLCKELGVTDEDYYDGERTPSVIDDSAVHMIRDNSKCILCRRCSAVCEKVQGIGVIGANMRGFATFIGSAFDMGLGETSCVSCGQCIAVCPTGALQEKDNTQQVFDALADPEKVVLVQTAPAVRAGLGEAFGYPIGTDVQGKMAAALRALGFDKVFDTNFGADLTIMEEASEFLERFTKGEFRDRPMFTSCCPGWIRFVKTQFPHMVKYLSTAKSPQQMFGAVMKTYYAQKLGVDPERIFTVSIMPCVAKKAEREMELFYEEYAGHDVDAVLTTRELVRMIRSAHIRPEGLNDIESDSPMREGTGAGVIFGATGGVMEAALRTAYFALKGKNAPADAFRAVRSLGFNANNGVQEAEFKIDDLVLRTAAVSGLGNTRALLERIDRGEVHYDFVEVMACPGGCVGGGGQPIHDGREMAFERGRQLYYLDAGARLRYSHENPDVKAMYEEFFEKPNSHKAHLLLHTEHRK